MSFHPNIPQSGQSLGQTRQLVEDNFTNYNTVVSVNHVAPNSIGQGKHNFCEFPSQGTVPNGAPATSAGEVALYCKTDAGTIPQLYLQKQSQAANATDIQMSRVDTGVLNAAAGYSFLPGGLIIQWKIGSATSAGNPNTFPLIFPNNCFVVNISIVGAAINSPHQVWVQTDYPSNVLASRTGFTAKSDSGALGISIIAIGN